MWFDTSLILKDNPKYSIETIIYKDEAVEYKKYLDIFIKNYDVLYKIFSKYSNN